MHETQPEKIQSSEPADAASTMFCSYVFTAAKLIAPVMDKKDWEAGYDWVVETIKLDHEYLASKMEVEKALHYLKTKEFDKVPVLFL